MQQSRRKAHDTSTLPEGISIDREWNHLVRYKGTEQAFLQYGLIRPEWLDGLGQLARSIALDPAGGFVLVGEGAGNHFTHVRRDHGAITIKRLGRGAMFVTKYRTLNEQRALEEAASRRYKQQLQEKESQRQSEEQGLLVDPGVDGATRIMDAASACFNVGERVICFPDGGQDGVEAKITGAYGTYRVREEDGPYIGKDGSRFAYRFGYLVNVDGERIFFPAHLLTRDDCKPSHLALVYSCPKQSSVLGCDHH